MKVKTVVHISAQDPSHLTGGQGVSTLATCRAEIKLGLRVRQLSMRLGTEPAEQVFSYAEGKLPVYRLSVSDSDQIQTPYEGNASRQVGRMEEMVALACSHVEREFNPEEVCLHLHGFYYIPLMAGMLSNYNCCATYHLLLTARMERSGELSDPIFDHLRMFEIA